MFHPCRTMLPAVLCAVLATAPTLGATLRTIQDTTFSGEPVSIRNGILTLALSTMPPTTQATTQASSLPANPAADVTVRLTDIAQLIFREPPPTPALPSQQAGDAQQVGAQPPGLFRAVVNSVFGGDAHSAGAATPASAPTDEAEPLPATTRPAGAIRCSATLSNGDHVHGRIEAWSNGTLSLRSPSTVRTLLAIPTDQLSEVWIADPADSTSQAKARALLHDAAGPEDVAFVRKDANTIVPVKGTVLGLDGDALQFRYDGRDRRIALAKLVGVVMSNRRTVSATDHFHFVVTLVDGDTLSCQWVGIRGNWLNFETAWGQRFSVIKGHVMRLLAVGGPVAYLSDMKPIRVEQIPFFGRVVPYRLDHALDGGPLQLADGPHEKGIATHAHCVLEYDLAGGYDRFHTLVGFEPDARDGSAAVRVLADGRAVYDAPTARGDRPPVPLDLDMTGVRRLTLVVDFGPEQDVQSRVDWADARLLRDPASASPPTTQAAPADEVRP